MTQTTGVDYPLFRVTFTDANNGWAVGGGFNMIVPAQSLILHTTNGGSTWTNQFAGTRNQLRGVTFSNQNNGWIVGENGTILHTSDNGETFVADKPTNKLPNQFNLSQNYPNPFNSKTEISYSLPTQGKVTLAVFDEMGRKISTLVNGYQSASQHRVAFDGTGLATGTYFYRLNVNGIGETRKMVLLK